MNETIKQLQDRRSVREFTKRERFTGYTLYSAKSCKFS